MYAVPYARTRWDEIVPLLHQGGHDFNPGGTFSDAQDVVVTNEFDLVISLYDRGKWYGPGNHVTHLVHQVPDGHLTDDELDALRGLASLAVESIVDGHPTLIRCQAGYNRSGLVVGLALLQLGHTAEDAVALIRHKRSRYALCNGLFVDYLHAEELRWAGVAA
jgi:protein-tyrosine phosphatase